MFRAGLRRLIRGVEGTLLGGQELASEDAQYRLSELTDLKRRRLPERALHSPLSVSSAHRSVFSFCIHLKESNIVTCLCQHRNVSAQIWACTRCHD